MPRPKFILNVTVNVKNYMQLVFFSFVSFPSIFFLSLCFIFIVAANYSTEIWISVVFDFVLSGTSQCHKYCLISPETMMAL